MRAYHTRALHASCGGEPRTCYEPKLLSVERETVSSDRETLFTRFPRSVQNLMSGRHSDVLQTQTSL